MSDSEGDCKLGAESENEDCELSDGELQEAFSRGLLKPGMNVPVEEPKRAVNNVDGLKKCLLEFKKNLVWAERLDVTAAPVADPAAATGGTAEPSRDAEHIDANDDFQREMFFYRQAQAAVLQALPKLHKLKIPTKRPEDYFAEMAKSDQHMQKIRKKLIQKQMAMEKSEKAKKLREQRKFGKKVQMEVLQKRQKEKKSMMTAVKKYQKGLTDKLDFMEGDGEGKRAAAGAPSKTHINKKGPNAKRRFKDSKFGFGGKKKGGKWNTKESYDDVSGFRAKVAHGKANRKFSKGGKNKRPGKETRRKMKARK